MSSELPQHRLRDARRVFPPQSLDRVCDGSGDDALRNGRCFHPEGDCRRYGERHGSPPLHLANDRGEAVSDSGQATGV